MGYAWARDYYHSLVINPLNEDYLFTNSRTPCMTVVTPHSVLKNEVEFISGLCYRDVHQEWSDFVCVFAPLPPIYVHQLDLAYRRIKLKFRGQATLPWTHRCLYCITITQNHVQIYTAPNCCPYWSLQSEQMVTSIFLHPVSSFNNRRPPMYSF